MDNSIAPTNKDYYTLFQSDPRGQAVLQQLSTLYYDGVLFDPDPYKHAFNAGRREVISYLLKRCIVQAPTEETQDE